MSEWTTATLKEYVDAQFSAILRLLDERKDAQQQAIAAALASVKEAIQKAENATERRFDSVNEFRQTLTDQAGTFATRDQVETLKEDLNRRQGAALFVSRTWGYIVGVVGVAAAVIAVVVGTRGSS